MSDTPVRVRANTAKHSKTATSWLPDQTKTDAVLRAEIDAMMERSSKRLAKLNADMEELLARLSTTRLTS